MKQILVGIDGSKESREAAEFAASLAQSLGKQLVLTSVVYVPAALGAPELLTRVQAWERDERARMLAALQDMAKTLERPGLQVQARVASGAPAETLADLANTDEVDMVVVGHRGRGAIKRLLTGSCADRLVQICTKPVTVVR